MAPRPATDPNRWKQVSGGRSIRRKPQKSNMQKALAALPFGKKAASGKTKSGSRGGTAGKAAMLTAAAGFAYKNRDKISGMLGKRRGGAQGTPETPPAYSTPQTPPAYSTPQAPPA